MKRFQVHVSVKDPPESMRFYSILVGTAPSVDKRRLRVAVLSGWFCSGA